MPHQHAKHFNGFLQNEVNLNQTRIDNLMTKRDNIDKFLKDRLPAYKGTEQQGSWALKTIIKPVRDGQEYDADLLLLLDHEPSWDPEDYISNVYKVFQEDGTYTDKVSKGTRCVTLKYAGDFHLDIVPCVLKIPDKVHKLHVCNSATNIFEPSDGNGYREWFNGQNDLTNGNLKRAVKLLKYLRDHRNNFTVKSILLTTLCGRRITQDNKSEAQTVADALLLITSEIKTYLKAHSSVPTIANPALLSENFNRHWNEEKYKNFKAKFISIADNIYEAYHEEDKSKSIKLWRNLFTDKFAPDTSSTASVKSHKEPPKPYCNV